ncbi:deoxyribose-phosphate aldolase [Polaribacter sp.]|jgi:deoxyribose-phosphate aldolase|nr:deoxyribose-phosphate aldolase [Polaribacter sp.]MDC1374172.1 deoxyribose-phosphate aldolase [Polaribacter sp.]
MKNIISYFCSMKMHQFLDATYLKSSAQAGITEAENLEIVKSLTNEAIANNYKLLMIRAKYIPKVKQLLRIANAPTLIGTVIGFHEGTSTVAKKLTEAETAIHLGADELDFVLNYNAFKEGNFQLIDQEIIACTKYCLEKQKVIKWIIETAALTNEEIVVISQRIREIVLKHFTIASAKNVFVKSSTGFYKTANHIPNGATLENMRLIIAHAKPLKVKAAGGVKTLEMAKKMIALGVDRIGTSSAKEIVKNEINSNKIDQY